MIPLSELAETLMIALATGLISSGGTIAVLKNDMKHVWRELDRQDKQANSNHSNMWTVLRQIEQTLKTRTN